MIALTALALAYAAPAAEPRPAPADIVALFASYCLDTRADRTAFDAKIGASTELEKISAPLLFSGLEFHRRWKAGAIELSFTEAPPPTPRSCAVTSGARGGFDGQAMVAEVAKASNTVMQQEATDRWIGMTPGGETLLVNNRPNPDGFGDVEIILFPND